MSVEVLIRNSQRAWKVDTRRLRELAVALLVRELGKDDAALGIGLVGARRMAGLNWQWLRHQGSTDILTFDHRSAPSESLHGELFISVDDAVTQAAEFGVTPGEELARYVVHGVLHLLDYDDLETSARRVMKREESRLVRRLGADFELRSLVMASVKKPRPGRARERSGRGDTTASRPSP